MKYKLGLIALVSMISMSAIAQTYIGQILFQNSYEYVKLVCNNDTCIFSMPYVDGDLSYSLPLNLATTTEWEVDRGVETWSFKTKAENNALVGELSMPIGQQNIKWFEQKDPLDASQLEPYEGVYEDDQQRRVIIYARYDYLHFMSPYSEETMSLKSIGQNNFWSVSGEISTFSILNDGSFQHLQITNQFGNHHQLHRVPSFTVEDLWIPIGEDTLFAKLYLPSSTEKVPACLILPGGGAIGMDNYIYEARLFAAHGIAALVFDKSGNGQSKGSRHFHRQSFEEKNDQYIALFRYLQNHPAVDAKQVGVHGPSEGGRLALMMAIDLGNEMAFAIATAGPFMTLKEGQFYAMDQHHRMMDISEYDNMKIQQIWSDYYDGIVDGQIEQSVIDRANVYRDQNPRLFLPPDFTALPSSPHRDDINNERVVLQAGKIKCPLLLQYGENDQRVNAQKSIANLLHQLSNPNQVQTIIYKRGDHSMMTPEYQICTGYASDKISWLKSIGI